jgi:hypothetical protein
MVKLGYKGVRGMTLLLEPGKEMVGDGREFETRLFGALCVAHQPGGPVLF